MFKKTSTAIRRTTPLPSSIRSSPPHINITNHYHQKNLQIRNFSAYNIFYKKSQQQQTTREEREEDENVDMSDAKTIARYYQNLEDPKRKYHYPMIHVPLDKKSLPYTVLFSNYRPWLFNALSAVSFLQVAGFLLLAVVIITRPHKNKKGEVIEPLWQRVASATMLVAVSGAILFGIKYYSRFYILEVGQLGRDTVRLVLPKIGLSRKKYIERYVPRRDIITKDMSLLYPEQHAHSGTRLARRKKIEDYFFLQIAGEKRERNYILDIGSKQTYMDRGGLRAMLGTRSHTHKFSFPYKKK